MPQVEYTLQVHDWDKWQSYRKDRGQPPWIKLHRCLIRSQKWVALSDAQRGQLICLWMLAADNEGRLPDNPRLLQKLCYMDKEPDLELFINHRLITRDATVTPSRRHGDATVTPSRRQDDAPEAEKSRVETEQNRKPLSSSASEPDRVRQVFEHWQIVMDHPKAKLDDKRRAKIKKRLADGYTVRDLCAAVDGCRRSPHHMGENDRGTRYDDIELICRDASHVDKFLKLADSPNLAELGSAGRQTANAAMEWINAD